MCDFHLFNKGSSVSHKYSKESPRRKKEQARHKRESMKSKPRPTDNYRNVCGLLLIKTLLLVYPGTCQCNIASWFSCSCHCEEWAYVFLCNLQQRPDCNCYRMIIGSTKQHLFCTNHRHHFDLFCAFILDRTMSVVEHAEHCCRCIPALLVADKFTLIVSCI